MPFYCYCALSCGVARQYRSVRQPLAVEMCHAIYACRPLQFDVHDPKDRPWPLLRLRRCAAAVVVIPIVPRAAYRGKQGPIDVPIAWNIVGEATQHPANDRHQAVPLQRQQPVHSPEW
jgi:hypothetical protein